MNAKQKKECHTIIHTANVWQREVLVRGWHKFQEVINAVITPIQLTMTISLGRVFGKSLSEASAKGRISFSGGSNSSGKNSLAGVGRLDSGIGNAINATTAAGITEAMGWLLAKRI